MANVRISTRSNSARAGAANDVAAMVITIAPMDMSLSSPIDYAAVPEYFEHSKYGFS